MLGSLDNGNLLGDFVRESRNHKKMTLRELSEISGVSFSQLSKIERGLAKPSKDTLDKIAYSLNTSKDELYIFAGYIGDDLQVDVANSLDFVVSAGGKMYVAEAKMPHYKVNQNLFKSYFAAEEQSPYDVVNMFRADDMKTSFASIIKYYDEKIDDDDIRFLANEMEAMYKLRKLKKKGARGVTINDD